MPVLRGSACRAFQHLNPMAENEDFTTEVREIFDRRIGDGAGPRHCAQVFSRPAKRRREGRKSTRLAAAGVEDVRQLAHGRQRDDAASLRRVVAR
jgi:hypothetical protein